MTETLFPADDAADRPVGDDVLEPLSRLEEQLRRSRERLVGGPTVASHAETRPEPPVPSPGAPAAAPSPYAALAELTPVPEFAPEPLGYAEPSDGDGIDALPLPDMPTALDLSFEIPEIPILELPEPFEALSGAPSSVGDDDDVWQPFTEVEGSDAVPDASVEIRPTTLEQEPLPVPPASPRSATNADADVAIAEAAREVSWLARRVADGLDAVTARLDGFDRRIAELARRPLDDTTVGPATSVHEPAPSAPAVAGEDDPTALEEWSMALARLVRSDSTALRDEVHRMAEEQGTALAEVHRLTEDNGARIARSVEETIARIDGAVLRLADAIEERLGSAVASLEAAADAMRSEDQEALVRLIDDRMEALARLVRSDNERLSARLEAEIGIGREVLRAAKELQASLANDVASALDQRDRVFRASGSGPR